MIHGILHIFDRDGIHQVLIWNLLLCPMAATLSTSSSERPSPHGAGARSIAYSPNRLVRKGRISSVCKSKGSG
jgi:hypothetical protein